MRWVKNNLHDIRALCAMTLLFAMVLCCPLVAPSPVLARAQERPPQQSEENQGQAATFAGTVVKDGEHYDLRDSSGEVFKLDDATRARPFAGKTVKVTGELNAQAKVIHVESIEGIVG